ncbi:transposase [Variovorax fucosicus]|uniref:transposase n=1 Tax=Variovorax fucosicus TaxID=3053517 RepID=UPI00403769E3
MQQLAALYRQRWEIELGFREIKQSLQANNFVLGRTHRLYLGAPVNVPDGAAPESATRAHRLSCGLHCYH